MNATVLIPVKSMSSAKSRLSKKLNAEQKEKLVLQMLRHVLKTANILGDEYQTVVVTSDQKVKNIAKTFGAKTILEKNSGQNRALAFAAKQINQDLPLLTLSADLPLLKIDDIEQMFLFLKQNDVVLAPSKEKTGTNAILMKQPFLLPYQFGKNSLDKFITTAEKQKLRFKLYDSPTIAFDVDTVEDLEKVNLISQN
jgi:2-phospho-L-lactate guanylyltransferase